MSEWICPDPNKGPGYYCLDCLKGSIVKRDAPIDVAICRWCKRDARGIAFENIELFVPYIPLQTPLENWDKKTTK